MKWYPITDKLPPHDEIILAYTPKGCFIAKFLESFEFHNQLIAKGMPEEFIYGDLPYSFISLEQGHYLTGVTHWTRLPKSMGSIDKDNESA